MRKRKAFAPERLEVEGNNGGSYIRITTVEQEGFCHLEVGETCVQTLSRVVSVAALAALITRCKDIGFEKLLAEYNNEPNGSPFFSMDSDPITGPYQGASQ